VRTLFLSNPSAIFLSRSEGILRRLASHPRTAQLRPVFLTCHGRLLAAHDAWMAAREEVASTQTDLDAADRHQEEKVGLAAFTLLGKVADDRRSPLWLRHFPSEPGSFVPPPATGGEIDVVSLANAFACDDDPELRALGPALAEAAARRREAAEDHRDAVLEEAAAYRELQLAKLHWNEGCRRLHAELRGLFRRDVRSAEMFFEERTRRRAAAGRRVNGLAERNAVEAAGPDPAGAMPGCDGDNGRAPTARNAARA